MQPANYYSSDMLTSSVPRWSCFTYVVNLRATCNPTTSVFSRSYFPGQVCGTCNTIGHVF